MCSARPTIRHRFGISIRLTYIAERHGINLCARRDKTERAEWTRTWRADTIEVLNMARQGARTIPLGMIQDREVSEQGSEKRITRYGMLTESKLERNEVRNPRKHSVNARHLLLLGGGGLLCGCLGS